MHHACGLTRMMHAGDKEVGAGGWRQGAAVAWNASCMPRCKEVGAGGYGRGRVTQGGNRSNGTSEWGLGSE